MRRSVFLAPAVAAGIVLTALPAHASLGDQANATFKYGQVPVSQGGGGGLVSFGGRYNHLTGMPKAAQFTVQLYTNATCDNTDPEQVLVSGFTKSDRFGVAQVWTTVYGDKNRATLYDVGATQSVGIRGLKGKLWACDTAPVVIQG